MALTILLILMRFLIHVAGRILLDFVCCYSEHLGLPMLVCFEGEHLWISLVCRLVSFDLMFTGRLDLSYPKGIGFCFLSLITWQLSAWHPCSSAWSEASIRNALTLKMCHKRRSPVEFPFDVRHWCKEHPRNSLNNTLFFSGVQDAVLLFPVKLSVSRHEWNYIVAVSAAPVRFLDWSGGVARICENLLSQGWGSICWSWQMTN